MISIPLPSPFALEIELGGWQLLGLLVEYTIKVVAIGWVPEGRRPSSSNAWLLLILLVPVVGLPLFLLMGSSYINRRRHRIQQEAHTMIEDVHAGMPDHPASALLTEDTKELIQLNRALTNLPAVAAINGGLITDYAEIIGRLTRAVNEARETVHVEIYIVAWDATTEPFFRALEAAVRRGVKVRLLFDQIGSFKYPGYWGLGRRLRGIGVDWRTMLPIKPLQGRFRRPDLRNHRKMVIVDGTVAFMGSFNLIDRSYLTRSHRRAGLQWVDAMVELEGPIVDSLNTVFAVDWYLESDEDLEISPHHEPAALPARSDSVVNTLQLVPSGPGYATEPNLRLFTSLVHRARQRLVLCSPYFVPDESLLDAITTACYRGVRVELFVSEQSDQFTVEHAQSSYYQALLEAGVHIYRFPRPYILHTKFLVSDPHLPEESVAVFGSSNMDMRSFGLNYEVSLLVARGSLLGEFNRLTDAYRAVSPELTLGVWKKRRLLRRYVDNVLRLTSALQ